MGRFNRDSRPGDDRGPREFGRREFGGGGRSFGGASSGPRVMHKAVCSECGKDCEIPFRPTGGRPIFCSNCFEKQGGGSSTRPMGGSNFSRPSFSKPSFGGDRQMFEATCGKCGDKCEVPFRPTEGKPVFCSNCFEKGGAAGGRNTEHYREQFDIINAKLEKIMKALNVNTSQPVVEEKVGKKVEEKKVVVPEETPKKGKKVFAKSKAVAKKTTVKKMK